MPQIHRPFRVKSNLGSDALQLENFEGHERISTPYRFIIQALAQDPNIDMKGQLKQPMVMSIKLEDGGERHIHGNVNRMKLMEVGDDGLALYEIELVPWFWFLHLFHDCRIFQNKTVPDIIKAVFAARGYSAFDDQTQGPFASREYCVQYRESDFNFVSRLMEEEGIFYYFKHAQDKATMVLMDDKSLLSPCPHKATARFAPTTGGELGFESVVSLEQELHIHTGKAELRDYDFTKPTTSLEASITGTDMTDGEFYDYPGKYTTKDDGDHFAKIRLEEREVRQNTVRGASNCMGFECGFKFTLSEFYRDEANQEYLITFLHTRGANPSYRSATDQGFEYGNRFHGIPSTVQFRPPRIARKPVIEGVQTAVVVGKSGEEIWTDQYGRVVVQFFWDRDGGANENSSCWIRVAQAWAGTKWGIIYTPRIGQEVIVTFIEGDPDRPIITGRVYNGANMPPYALPDEQTKSTIKSLSSKGGGGFNEIRFEDKKGSEQVFVHAERNLDMLVKANRMESIGGDRSLTVGSTEGGGHKYEKLFQDEHNHVLGNRQEKIEKDHYLKILGDQGIQITGNHSTEVTGNLLQKVTGNHNTEVTQNVYIKGLQIVIEAEIGLTLKMGPNFITLDPSGLAISGVPMTQINSAGSALSGSPGTPVTLTDPTDPTASDNAQPGSVDSPASPAAEPPLTLPLTDLSPDQPQQENPDEPDRPVPQPGAGGGPSSGNPEPSTFPGDVDPVAIANVLQNASQSGTPFCEECRKTVIPDDNDNPAGASGGDDEDGS